MLLPEATAQASPTLCAKIAKLLNRKKDFTKVIKGKKEIGNPAVLAQVRTFVGGSPGNIGSKYIPRTRYLVYIN